MVDPVLPISELTERIGVARAHAVALSIHASALRRRLATVSSPEVERALAEAELCARRLREEAAALTRQQGEIQ